MQARPSAHLGQLVPPQSTSVSPLPVSFMVLKHSAEMHSPPEQWVLVQSLLFPQVFPSSHLVGQGPPQSTSLSPWFFTLSEQLGVAQVPPVHLPLVQSLSSPHILPSAHLVVQAPPQSLSL